MKKAAKAESEAAAGQVISQVFVGHQGSKLQKKHVVKCGEQCDIINSNIITKK